MSKKTFKIDPFWKHRINGVERSDLQLVSGWSFIDSGLDTFVEAPLAVSQEFTEVGDADFSPIILVSAPGAVGKSTLARQIAFETNSIYVDLAEADVVGGNTLSGGIRRSGLSESWDQCHTAILLDALDESRLHATQEAFEDFLENVAQEAADRNVPTVLFGRTGAIQDAWLILSDAGIEAPILEIGFYDEETASAFAMARVRAGKPESAYVQVENDAIRIILEKLRSQTEQDGDRFSGYAPVLEAVARTVVETKNLAVFISDMNSGKQPITLLDVGITILEREQHKLDELDLTASVDKNKLYTPKEQLDRLFSRVFGTPLEISSNLNSNDSEKYETALESWVPDHAFLDGQRKPNSVVFSALISSNAFTSDNAIIRNAALDYELAKGRSANPFLSEFFNPFANSKQKIGTRFIPADQIGVFYSSVRASLAHGDIAKLTIDSDEEADDETALRADIEISIERTQKLSARQFEFYTDLTKKMRLGSNIANVQITAPFFDLEVGTSHDVTFVAPINIQCNEINFLADRVIVENGGKKLPESIVYIEARSIKSDSLTSVPTLRGSVKFLVSWEGAKVHPWSTFFTEPTPVADLGEEEALRRLRKFIVVCHSDSAGQLICYRSKVDDTKMTKGMGEKILLGLLEVEIFTAIGTKYLLDPSKLGSIAGATYLDLLSKNYSQKTREFVRGIIQ